MPKISLYLNKSIDQNASIYFEKAKKCKKKIGGAKEQLELNLKKLEKLKKKNIIEKEKTKTIKKTKKEWYEKFRWFVSSEGFLVIGGRDATTNEIVIKKHTNDDDLVLHTEIQGSPFFIIKAEGKEIPKATIEEAAQATASYSRGWKIGLSNLEIEYMKPDQLTKTPKSGEYLTKGSFIITGTIGKLNPELGLAIGIKEDSTLIGGPIEAIKKHSKKFLTIAQGNKKPSEIAKIISKKFDYPDLDEIIRFLPSGNCDVV